MIHTSKQTKNGEKSNHETQPHMHTRIEQKSDEQKKKRKGNNL